MSKKAVFFDASNGKFSDVTYEGLDDIYKMIGCSLVEVALRLGTGDVVFVDEEGMLKEIKYQFRMEGGGYFAGHAVIVGPTDEEGNTLDVTRTAKEFEESLEFEYWPLANPTAWQDAALLMLQGIDWALLKEQKDWLYRNSCEEDRVQSPEAEGLLELIDQIQDYAYDYLQVPKDVLWDSGEVQHG